jgi:L-threonate 2-dehydrogenase
MISCMPSPQIGDAQRTGRAAVGVIGLGSLGLPLARNLVAGGFDVLGYQRTPSRAIVAAGGALATSVRDIGERCRIIVTCLPSSSALAEVVSGPGGLVDSVAPGTIVVDVSTLPVTDKSMQLHALRDVGAMMLDCSISGNHRYVSDRTAALFASGSRTDYERCESVLTAITGHVAFVGEFGAGTTLKLIASLLVPVHTLVAAEALALAKRSGLDPALVLDAIKGSQASSTMFETRGAAMVAGDFAGPSLSDYHRRNIVPTLALAESRGGHYPLLRAMDACYRQAMDAGFGHLDQSAIIAYLLERDA